jgi:hypothetical protein
VRIFTDFLADKLRDLQVLRVSTAALLDLNTAADACQEVAVLDSLIPIQDGRMFYAGRRRR